jgi:hypothetical protein
MERPFDLDLMQQSRHPRKDLAPPEHLLAVLHELRDGMAAIADALLQLGRDERGRLALVQLQPAREPLLGEEACLCGMSNADATERWKRQTWCRSSLASSLGTSLIVDQSRRQRHTPDNEAERSRGAHDA